MIILLLVTANPASLSIPAALVIALIVPWFDAPLIGTIAIAVA
jgi:hypothetical protein